MAVPLQTPSSAGGYWLVLRGSFHRPQPPPPLAFASRLAARVSPSARGKDCLECAPRFLIDSSAEGCPHPIRLGDSSRKHPTELARGRLGNRHSEPIIQRATAILQVAHNRTELLLMTLRGGSSPLSRNARAISDA